MDSCSDLRIADLLLECFYRYIISGLLATWNAEDSRKLMRVVLEWRSKGNTGPVDWSVMRQVYNNQSEVPKTDKQLKNHYNMCKSRWKAFMALQSMTGVELDTRGLPSEEELQSDRIAAFRKTHGSFGTFVLKNELVDIDLWHAEFAGKVATGKDSYSPAMVRKRSASKKGKEVPEEGSDDSDDISPIRRMATLDIGEEESRSPPRTSSSKRRRGGSSSSRCKDDEDFVKAYEMIQLAAPRLTIAKRLYEQVSKMAYVTARGVDYKVAVLKYLKEKGCEELFLELVDEAERIAWIRDVPY